MTRTRSDKARLTSAQRVMWRTLQREGARDAAAMAARFGRNWQAVWAALEGKGFVTLNAWSRAPYYAHA